jgi:glycosidase
LTPQQKQAQDFFTKILNWRKTSKAVHWGSLKHFSPNEGVYVYFRTHEKETVMVVLNKNKEEKTIATDRFSEVMENHTSGKEVISGMNITDMKNLKVPGRSAMIIELK